LLCYDCTLLHLSVTVKAHHYYHRHCRYYSNNVVQQLGDIRRIFTTSSQSWTTVSCQHVSRHSLDGAADADISRLCLTENILFHKSYPSDSCQSLVPYGFIPQSLPDGPTATLSDRVQLRSETKLADPQSSAPPHNAQLYSCI